MGRYENKSSSLLASGVTTNSTCGGCVGYCTTSCYTYCLASCYTYCKTSCNDTSK